MSFVSLNSREIFTFCFSHAMPGFSETATFAPSSARPTLVRDSGVVGWRPRTSAEGAAVES
eukprot:2416288-Pyramimonas_sp.AAC.1